MCCPKMPEWNALFSACPERNFDKISLVIPDDQIKPLPIVEKPVEIDLSDTKPEGPETIAGPSNQQQMRKFSPTKEESRRGTRVQSDKARETRTTGSKGHSAAEGRPVRSGKTTVRPCPYYLRNRFNEPEGIPGEQRSTGIDSLPQNSLRKRSLSMEALDGDPADRTT
ncbi:UNVERIFIED_CONTAM: hypothetical protein NCL1_51333 [Trichonephila clavipes]